MSATMAPASMVGQASMAASSRTVDAADAQAPGALRRRAGAVEGAPGDVVGAIAGRGVVGADVLGLAEVHGGRVQPGVDVVVRDLDPLEGAVTGLALGRRVGERAGEGVDLEARAETALGAVEAGAVGVGAADAEARAGAGRVAGAAEVLLERGEAVLQPAHTDLLEASVLGPVDVLADDGVLVVVRDPEQLVGADVAGGRAERVARHAAGGAVVGDARDIADDHVSAGRGVAAGIRGRDRDRELARAACAAVPGADADVVGRAPRTRRRRSWTGGCTRRRCTRWTSSRSSRRPRAPCRS